MPQRESIPFMIEEPQEDEFFSLREKTSLVTASFIFVVSGACVFVDHNVATFICRLSFVIAVVPIATSFSRWVMKKFRGD